MLVSSGLMFLPTGLALDAEHDIASSDEDLTCHPATDVAEAEAENVSARDINEISADPAPQTERNPVRFGHIARGMIKPLVALITAQYVIVAALVAGAALTVAHHASRIIHEKFAAIASALDRF